MERQFIIDEKVLNKILSYLGTNPYNQVVGLIGEIMDSIQPLNIPEDKE